MLLTKLGLCYNAEAAETPQGYFFAFCIQNTQGAQSSQSYVCVLRTHNAIFLCALASLRPLRYTYNLPTEQINVSRNPEL